MGNRTKLLRGNGQIQIKEKRDSTFLPPLGKQSEKISINGKNTKKEWYQLKSMNIQNLLISLAHTSNNRGDQNPI